jgi:hypothetical protein
MRAAWRCASETRCWTDVGSPPLELHLRLDTCGVIALWSPPGARGRLTWKKQLGLSALFPSIIFLLMQLQ